MIRKKPSDRIYQAIIYTALTLLAFSTLYPFIYFLAISFNDGRDALKGGIYFWPRLWSLENYAKAFEYPNMLNSFWITISRTASVTFISVFMTALMAYALTIKSLPFRRQLLFFFYFTTLFSGGLIPTFILYKDIKIYSTFWVLLLPSIYSFWYTLIMRAYFNGIPSSLSESARIDGANPWMIMLRIYMPLALPSIATVALFSIVGHWNAFFDGIIYINDASKVPLQTYIQRLVVEIRDTSMLTPDQIKRMNEVSSKTFNAAKIFVTMLPVMAIYPFLQRYFITGLVLGSVKE